jgi:hypothetical protein
LRHRVCLVWVEKRKRLEPDSDGSESSEQRKAARNNRPDDPGYQIPHRATRPNDLYLLPSQVSRRVEILRGLVQDGHFSEELGINAVRKLRIISAFGVLLGNWPSNNGPKIIAIHECLRSLRTYDNWNRTWGLDPSSPISSIYSVEVPSEDESSIHQRTTLQPFRTKLYCFLIRSKDSPILSRTLLKLF